MRNDAQFVHKLSPAVQRNVNMTRCGRIEVTDDVLAGLIRLYERMAPARQRQFWQIEGSQLAKAAFLLRWGSFEVYEKGEEAT